MLKRLGGLLEIVGSEMTTKSIRAGYVLEELEGESFRF